MKIGVTGASSGIGKATIRAIQEAGMEPVKLGRHQGDRQFDLCSPLDPRTLEGLSGVIHLAWYRSPRSISDISEDPSFTGSIELFFACKHIGARAVFLSSSSALYPDKSRYGASKLAVENQARGLGVTSMRAGLIWGGDLSPILLALSRLAAFPIAMPVPRPDMVLDHNHESFVASRLVQGLFSPMPAGSPLSLASPETVTSLQVLETLRNRPSSLVIPVPSRVVATTARWLRDSRFFSMARLDSLAILDVVGEKLAFDSTYPSEWGRSAFLEWLQKRVK